MIPQKAVREIDQAVSSIIADCKTQGEKITEMRIAPDLAKEILHPLVMQTRETTWKGLPVKLDAKVPSGEIIFVSVQKDVTSLKINLYSEPN